MVLRWPGETSSIVTHCGVGGVDDCDDGVGPHSVVAVAVGHYCCYYYYCTVES